MHTYEAFSILDEVYNKFGASEFGRMCQILLGFSFIESGYKIPTMQLSGRPDIISSKDGSSFIIEVKTSKLPVIRLKKDDLQGIIGGRNSKSVVAVLSYPDIDIFWILADASRLNAGEYLKSSLRIFGISGIEDEINHSFFSVIDKLKSSLLLGTNILLQVFREAQNNAL
jgi:hypothetical protein